MYVWLRAQWTHVQGQGHFKVKYISSQGHVKVMSRSRSRSSQGQGHPRIRSPVCYSNVHRSLLDTAIFYRSMYVWLIQGSVTLGPRSRSLQGQVHFKVKVISKVKVIRGSGLQSATVMSIGICWTQLSSTVFIGLINVWSGLIDLGPQVKVIWRSRSSQGQSHVKVRSPVCYSNVHKCLLDTAIFYRCYRADQCMFHPISVQGPVNFKVKVNPRSMSCQGQGHLKVKVIRGSHLQSATGVHRSLLDTAYLLPLL